MKRPAIFLAAVLFAIVSCNKKPEKTETDIKQPVTEKPATAAETTFDRNIVNVENGRMTPEILWSLGRVGEAHVSPDKTKILFGVSYYSIKQNRGNRDLYLMNTDGSDLTQITKTDGSEYSAVWRPDGKKIAFMSAVSGSPQLWEMNSDGSDLKQISNEEGGISNFLYAPTLDKILFTKDVKVDQTIQERHPDLPLATAKVIDNLMYRHWDHWEDENYSHIFVADYKDGTISNAVDIMQNEPYDAPMQPWGGIDEIAWHPQAKSIAYTCKKLTGKDYALSTNSAIYVYDLAGKATRNITEAHLGYDKYPVFSSDGAKLAWISMERNGFEADKERLFIYDFTTETAEYMTPKFDQGVAHHQWTADNKNILFKSGIEATHQIYKIDVATKEIAKITDGIHDYLAFEQLNDKLIAEKQSMLLPTDIYSVSLADGLETQISHINKELLDQLKMARVEKRWIKTTDKKDMLTWIIYPPHFDKNKKYPTLLFCEGGPQSTVSQFWSYRWNMQIMAANGYIVVAPNRRGLPGFGYEWLTQISGDYGGQNMKDYLSAIDAMAK